MPGNFGGGIVAGVICGDINSSGKLPYNYPRYPPNALIPYIHKHSEEQIAGEGVYNYEADYSSQFSFEDGLSYTTFEFTDLKIDRNSIIKTCKINVQVKETNTGKRKGKEVVELYISDLYATGITPDVKCLRRLK